MYSSLVMRCEDTGLDIHMKNIIKMSRRDKRLAPYITIRADIIKSMPTVSVIAADCMRLSANLNLKVPRTETDMDIIEHKTSAATTPNLTHSSIILVVLLIHLIVISAVCYYIDPRKDDYSQKAYHGVN